MDKNNAEKILSTIREKYFLGQIVEIKPGVLDFFIVESNHSQYKATNPYLSEMIDKVNGVDRLILDLDRVQESREYETETYRIVSLENDEWIIWIKPKYEKELIQAQADLACQKSLLQLFIEAIPDLVFYKDINSTYITCNQVFADFLGKEKKDIIGKTDKELEVLRPQAHTYRAFDQSVIQSKKGITIEERVYSANKELKIMETLKVPFEGENNALLGLIGISRDVTEKIKADVKLKQNEERFRKVFENISDAIILVQEGKILEVNPAYETIFNESITCAYEYESITTVIDKLFKEDLENSKVNYTGKAWTYKGRVIRGNEEEKWVKIKYTKMDEEKNIGLIVITDITSKHLKDKELECLRDEFFSNLSHEFKTPINLIHSALDLLKLNLMEQSICSDLYEKYFRICGQNTTRLLKLTNNLIDVTKIESGNFNYYPKMCNIVKHLDEIVESISHYCEQKGMSILFDPQEEEINAYCDMILIERIVLNLVSNAIKYSQGKQILISMCCENENIILSVEDDGLGMPEDQLESIFERFTRITNRFSKRGEGSGLGLYLVKALTEVHGGDVWVKSSLGQGAKFTIQLPQYSASRVEMKNSNYTSLNDIKEKIAFELCDLT